MDLTHTEKTDTLLSEMKQEGGDPRKVGRYVECLTQSRKLILDAEGEVADIEFKIEKSVENREDLEELENGVEKYEEDVLRNYREAEQLLKKAMEIRQQLSDIKLTYADKIVSLERISLIEDAPGVKKVRKMYDRLFTWVGGLWMNAVGSIPRALGKLSSKEGSEDLGWNFDKAAHLTGYKPYKHPKSAFEDVEKERQMSEEILKKAEKELEDAE